MSSSIQYPLLGSIWGMTKTGKSTLAATFPNAFVIDFAQVAMSYGHAEILPQRSVGEAYFSVRKVTGFDIQQQYRYVKTWDEFKLALQDAQMYAESLKSEPAKAGKCWLVLDDSYRWRVFALLEYIRQNKRKWPIQQEWGRITQAMQSDVNEIQNFANLLIVHRMVKDFDTGQPVAQIMPSGIDFVGDFAGELALCEKDGKRQRVFRVVGNRHDDECSDTYCREVVSPDGLNVLMSLRVPPELW